MGASALFAARLASYFIADHHPGRDEPDASISYAPGRGLGEKRKRLLLLSVLVELRDVGPEILGFLLVLDACEGHLGVGNLCLGVLDVVEELVLVPGDAGVLVGIGIAEAFHRAGLA